MARTLIGELILRLKDEMSGRAKSTASSVTHSMADIERAAKRLNSVPWGVGFQRQMDKLKLAPREMAAVQRSWQNLNADLSKRSMSKALAGNELSAWRTATVSHFAAVRMEAGKLSNSYHRLRMAGRVLAAGAGVGMVGYGLPVAGRRGIEASSNQERERFRQSMAGFSEADRSG